MAKTRSKKDNDLLAGIFLIGLGIGIIIGAFIMPMFWGA